MTTKINYVMRIAIRTGICRCRLHNRPVLQAHKAAILSSRQYSTEPLPEPHAEGREKNYPPKIQNIVEEISRLTLLEVADLNELLKKTLNIQDAPVMAMGAAPAGAPKKEEEEEEVAPVREKSLFSVKLTEFDTAKKIALIKEIKNLIPGTNLVQAKKFVESVPVVVKTDIIKEEAETLLKALENAGGKAQID